MKSPLRSIAAVAWLVAGATAMAGAWSAAAERGTAAASASFEQVAVHLEENATDRDAEIVIEAQAAQGLAALEVTSPAGRVIVDFSTPEAHPLGIRQFRFESPEPKDVASLKTAYPEGVYAFTGKTAGGAPLRGTARLSHRLPAPVAFLRPAAGAREIPPGTTEIAWTPRETPAAIIVHLEQEGLGLDLTVKLPGTATRFVVSADLVLPGREYVLAIGAAGRDGNSSFVETTFTTTARKTGR